MSHRILCLLVCAIAFITLHAQSADTSPSANKDDVQEVEVPIMTQVGSTQYKGHTIPHIIMPALPKYAPLTFKNDKERQEYNRLVYNVKKVLPWAKLAKLTIIETVEVLDQLPDKRSRDEHIKSVERGLKQQYGPALKKLTRSQGRLLIKLVNRECNQTGYAISHHFNIST